MKYDVIDLVNKFNALRTKQAELFDSYYKDMNGERLDLVKFHSVMIEINKINDTALELRKEITKDNVSPNDELSDVIHDVILCNGDFNERMPNNTIATIIDVRYCTIIRENKVLCHVVTEHDEYLMNVSTPDRHIIGTIFKGDSK